MPGREGDLMDVNEAIAARHSVRRYTTRPIGDDAVRRLRAAIDEANAASGLSIQLVRNEPDAFSSPLRTLGQFRNVSNYLAFVAPEGDDQDELVGYYGEGIILLAQQLGLNSCWVGGTYDRKRAIYRANPGQRLALVATLGYGETQGKPHKERAASTRSRVRVLDVPAWFDRGMEAVMLGPSAMGRQGFLFQLEADGDTVHASAAEGAFSRFDLGIAERHFEAASRHRVADSAAERLAR